MNRQILQYLLEWLSRSQRKPLVIRGARQVGKTWAVRELAKRSQRKLVEINFEKRSEHTSLFDSNDPQQILLQIGAAYGSKIVPHETLLFLDEIQVMPTLLAKLRWFAEELPELPVIAAGSLLEFVLADHEFSMPVGRIGYVHMEPLSFEEFLIAHGKDILVEYLQSYTPDTVLPIALHEQLILLFKEYLLVGGLPAAVSDWVNNRDLSSITEIQHNIVSTYRDDFTKYRGRLDIARLEEVFEATPRLLSQSFKYSHVNNTVSTSGIKQALNLLCKARICHRVRSTHGNGLPLAAEAHSKIFKVIFLDVGLCSAALGLTYNQFIRSDTLDLINKGGLAEQVVGQLLRTINPPYIEPALFYWQNDKPGAMSEIDYLITHGHRVIPIEVKAGTTGTLKSLHVFMGLKDLPLAIRINADVPTITPVQVKTSDGNTIQYQLLSIPFYLVGQIHRLLDFAL
jgi:uncharacterized protein